MINPSLFFKYNNKLDFNQLVQGQCLTLQLTNAIIDNSDESKNDTDAVFPGDIIFKTIESSSRKYLDDFKPFSDIFSIKSIFTQLIKATLIPANLIIHEYNTHLIEYLELDESEWEEFDFNTAINKNFALFISNWKRLMSVTFIRKVLEEFSLKNYPLKITDKLTKDLGKSIVRKSLKLSRIAACKKIFFTALWSNYLSNLSYLIYDISTTTGGIIMDYLRVYFSNREQTSLFRRFRKKRFLLTCIKKIAFHSVCLLSSAGGFAIGSFIHIKHGGNVVSFATEMLVGFSFSVLIGL